MKNSGLVNKLFDLVIAVVVIAAMYFFLIMVLARVDKYLKQEAMAECAKISSFSTTDQAGNKVSYPVKEIYANCLKEKGY